MLWTCDACMVSRCGHRGFTRARLHSLSYLVSYQAGVGEVWRLRLPGSDLWLSPRDGLAHVLGGVDEVLQSLVRLLVAVEANWLARGSTEPGRGGVPRCRRSRLPRHCCIVHTAAHADTIVSGAAIGWAGWAKSTEPSSAGAHDFQAKFFLNIFSLKSLGEFQPKIYKVSRNLAENYKSRQNTANPNISRIFGWAEFFNNSARESIMMTSKPTARLRPIGWPKARPRPRRPKTRPHPSVIRWGRYARQQCKVHEKIMIVLMCSTWGESKWWESQGRLTKWKTHRIRQTLRCLPRIICNFTHLLR